MTDIPNTEYITINKDGIYVGGVHATHYRGAKIEYVDDVNRLFQGIQKMYPSIRELHVGAFDTRGKYAEPGNPSGKPGVKTWGRVMFSNGKVGDWVFFRGITPSACAYSCSSFVWQFPSFCSALQGQSKMVKISKPGCYVMVMKKNLQKVK